MNQTAHTGPETETVTVTAIVKGTETETETPIVPNATGHDPDLPTAEIVKMTAPDPPTDDTEVAAAVAAGAEDETDPPETPAATMTETAPDEILVPGPHHQTPQVHHPHPHYQRAPVPINPLHKHHPAAGAAPHRATSLATTPP